MKRYITTAIDYVNNIPHLGTAYEKVGADVIARFFRMKGDQVHFQMGNDEHSLNVQREAEKQGVPPKVYCDDMRVKFEAIWKSLDISYDDFIQTSEPRHHASVKAFLEKLDPKDIFKKEYEGWYCDSCEAFQTEKELIDGLCPNHKKKPTWLKEENYFFALSRFQERLLEHYKKNPHFILPEIRRNEVLSLVKSGLQDISISRSTFTWGIPFPQDPKHVVYVWFDALLNYITAAGFGVNENQFSTTWPADLHVIGKDITRFHCVIWPAMLMSAGLPIPKTVFGHGFVYLKGEKMSKSLGNVLTPLDIVPQYGSDALRYYLLRESSFGSDGDFTWDNFITRYNADLANDIGNILNRTLGMMNKYLSGVVPQKENLQKASPQEESEELKLKILIDSSVQKLTDSLDIYKEGDFQFHKALSQIWEIIAAGDKYIDTMGPWKLDKEGKKEELKRVLYHALDIIRNVAILVSPFIPGASQKIWKQLGLEKINPWAKVTFNDVGWEKMPASQVDLGQPIFPRIEKENSEKKSETNKKGKTMEPVTTPPASAENVKELIAIDDFMKVELRVAEVVQAEKVEGADKLLKLQVKVGEEARQIVAGIALHYKPEELVGKKIIIVANLKPAKLRGIESQGMLLAASDESGLSIVTLDRLNIVSGSKVK